MPRRRVVAKREILPDPKFGNQTLAKFMNHVMISGKKSVAESIVYGALDLVEERTKRDPIEVFDEALENIAPMVEVKSRRVGGATYQVPVEVRPARRGALSMRWLVDYARNRGEKSMRQRLAEIIDAAQGKGNAVIAGRRTHGGSQQGLSLPILIQSRSARSRDARGLPDTHTALPEYRYGAHVDAGKTTTTERVLPTPAVPQNW